MGRKSKQAGGNLPLTHYERTKKFSSSEYGTVSQRLAGHSQYQLGFCALSITSLKSEKIGMCTPSGYLYSEQAIIEYMLTKTKEVKTQQIAYEMQQQKFQEALHFSESNRKKMKLADDFESAQKVVNKKTKLMNDDDELQKARKDIKRTSYWLATSQNAVDENNETTTMIELPPDRPLSPFTQTPLRRKEIWPVQLSWNQRSSTTDVLICAISQKSISSQQAIVYWTDKSKPGTIVLESVYNDLIGKDKFSSHATNEKDPNGTSKLVCPLTSRKIKFIRYLQRSGSSFASSGQNVQVQQYRPTIT